jgi:hypothetical protein
MSELLKLNVNEHTEKKGNLTYLSWAWAWSTVLGIDPLATWEAVEFNGLPCAFMPDSSAMVKTIVTIKGHAKSCWLPVMDNKNKAIKNPDSFAVNTAIVRCLTKAISMHGLGLYIYAGEDLPQADAEDDAKARSQWLADRFAEIATAKSVGELKKIMDAALAKVRENNDHDAEDQLHEASLAKVSKAKPKPEVSEMATA